MNINNIDKIRERLYALWDREIIDRVCISVSAPKDPKNPYISTPPTSDADLYRWYNDADWINKRTLERVDKTYFAGDALPNHFSYFGTGGHAKYLAPESAVEYRPDTVWIHPVMDDLETFSYEFDPKTNVPFKREVEVLKYLAANCDGRYLVGMPDNSGNYDALAELRGNEELMIDFITEPELVLDAGRKITEMLRVASEYFYDAVSENCFGGSCISWMNTLSKGKSIQLQCDLAAMISPDIYRDFIVEELTTMCNWLDNSVYHFDGIEQIRALDHILSVEKLQMIQWTQVAGQPPATEYFDELQKIQKAGKGLILMISKSQLKPILDNLSIKGLNLIVEDASSPEEADELVKIASTYTR